MTPSSLSLLKMASRAVWSSDCTSFAGLAGGDVLSFTLCLLAVRNVIMVIFYPCGRFEDATKRPCHFGRNGVVWQLVQRRQVLTQSGLRLYMLATYVELRSRITRALFGMELRE